MCPRRQEEGQKYLKICPCGLWIAPYFLKNTLEYAQILVTGGNFMILDIEGHFNLA